MTEMFSLNELEGVELDEAFIIRHICCEDAENTSQEASGDSRKRLSKQEEEIDGVPQQELLLSICERFVKSFLMDNWDEMEQLDQSILECLHVLTSVQDVLEDSMKQLQSIQEEMGDVREKLTDTTVRLANHRISETVLWGVISQLLLPPEIVSLLTKASDERLGEQYKADLKLLLRYLQYRRSTVTALDESCRNEPRRSASPEQPASPMMGALGGSPLGTYATYAGGDSGGVASPLARTKEQQENQEHTLRQVRISFKNCKSYYDLIRVLDSVTVLACVKVKHFLSRQLKVLAVPNTNICIQQEHSLKEHTFYVYFLKYAPGLLHHASSGKVRSAGVENRLPQVSGHGEAKGDESSAPIGAGKPLVPYRIVTALYREFRTEYCSILSEVYLQKFKSYVFDCNALEYPTTVSRASTIFSSQAGSNSSGAPGVYNYVLPQLSDMVTAVAGPGPWAIGERGNAILRAMWSTPPLILGMEKMKMRKHTYEETIRSLFRLLCDVVTHEYLFSFQLFCGDTSVFFDTFKPIIQFVLDYISEIVLKQREGAVVKMVRDRWDGSTVNQHACEDCYGLLIIIRMCHEFCHFMNHERHLSCLNGFFDAVLRLLWPSFHATYSPQRIALRCVAPTALIACLAGPSLSTLEQKMCTVHPLTKSLSTLSCSILSIILGAKNIREPKCLQWERIKQAQQATEEVSDQKSQEKQARSSLAHSSLLGEDEKTHTPGGEEHHKKKRGIRHQACAIINAQGRGSYIAYSIEHIQTLLQSMSSLRAEALRRLEEVASLLLSKESAAVQGDAALFKSAFILNNVYYIYAQLHQTPVILTEEAGAATGLDAFADAEDEQWASTRRTGTSFMDPDSEGQVPTVGSRCDLEDVLRVYEESRKNFIEHVVRKNLSEISELIPDEANASQGEGGHPPHQQSPSQDHQRSSSVKGTPVDPNRVRRAAEQFAAYWPRMMNGVRDCVHHLIADPDNKKDVIAQACMECLLRNTRFHALVKQQAKAHPEAFNGISLSSTLIMNQKILVHMRSFSSIPEQ